MKGARVPREFRLEVYSMTLLRGRKNLNLVYFSATERRG